MAMDGSREEASFPPAPSSGMVFSVVPVLRVAAVPKPRTVRACAAVKSSGSPVPAVVRPLIVAVAISASFVLLTASLAMVVALLPAEAVTSPVRADRRIPLPLNSSPLPTPTSCDAPLPTVCLPIRRWLATDTMSATTCV